MVFILLVLELRRARQLHNAVWLLTGTVAVGITTLNILLLGLALTASDWARRRAERPWRCLRRPARVCSLVAVVVGLLATGLSPLFNGGRLWPMTDGAYLYSPLTEAVVELSTALGAVLIGRTPVIVVNEDAVRRQDPIAITLSYSDGPRPSDVAGLVLLVVLLATGLVGWRSAPTHLRGMIGVLPLVLAVYVGVHLLYGHEFFLYSLHWVMPILAIIAGIAWLDRVRDRAVPFLAVLAAVLLVWNVGVFKAMLALVTSYLGGS